MLALRLLLLMLLGVQLLQNHVHNNIYEKALQDTEHIVNLQVFRMVLCGVPRSGKTTFWKRIAIKDFKPSKESASTGAAESHIISAVGRDRQESGQKPQAHMHAEMLFDLHLYSEDRDLDSEALTIYQLILERHKPQPETQKSQDEAHNPQTRLQNEPQASKNETPVHEHQASQTHNIDASNLKADKSLQPVTDSEESETLQSGDNQKGNSASNEIPAALPALSQQAKILSKRQPSDPIITEINGNFEKLNDLLKSKDLFDILNVKKVCHLQDTGGQRAFLELLPTLSTGKALYLLFFNYKNFGKSDSETMQAKGSTEELHTGIEYEQIDVIMQSLICVSTASEVIQSTVESQPTEQPAESLNNIALLVGTHVDEVTSEDVTHANNIIYERVKPFLKNRRLVHAEHGGKKENLVLMVAIERKNDLCSNDPKDYVNVIMNIVDNELKSKESEELPASWYMFCIMLRRLQCAGYSVLQYSHCQHVAKKLYIQPSALKSLLFRLRNVFGIVLYFPEVKGLEDIVVCDPAFVYRSISELIFESFHGRCDVPLLKKLNKHGIFKYKELEKHCKINQDIELHKLIILLKHLGIIAPVKCSVQRAESKFEDESDIEDIHPDQEYVIPCVLKEAKQHELDVQLQDTQACSIVPLRIYFDCGFAPMGGFCYLFTKLISDNKRWKLCLPDVWEDENNVYWRNKVTFEVEFDSQNYLVTLLSTDEYYEIHIKHSVSKQPFKLRQDGHRICKHVWKAIHTVLQNPPNKSLQTYKTACICNIGHPETDKHVMKFQCNPHENLPNIKAHCERSKCHTPVIDTQPSVMVWFKVR